MWWASPYQLKTFVCTVYPYACVYIFMEMYMHLSVDAYMSM